MTDTSAILEQALKLLERGELPEKVNDELLWAGLIHLHAQAKETNGNVKKNDKRITRLEVLLGGASGLGILGILTKLLIDLF